MEELRYHLITTHNEDVYVQCDTSRRTVIQVKVQFLPRTINNTLGSGNSKSPTQQFSRDRELDSSRSVDQIN